MFFALINDNLNKCFKQTQPTFFASVKKKIVWFDLFCTRKPLKYEWEKISLTADWRQEGCKSSRRERRLHTARVAEQTWSLCFIKWLNKMMAGESRYSTSPVILILHVKGRWRCQAQTWSCCRLLFLSWDVCTQTKNHFELLKKTTEKKNDDDSVPGKVWRHNL